MYQRQREVGYLNMVDAAAANGVVRTPDLFRHQLNKLSAQMAMQDGGSLVLAREWLVTHLSSIDRNTFAHFREPARLQVSIESINPY